jgi:hypothetical protein
MAYQASKPKQWRASGTGAQDEVLVLGKKGNFPITSSSTASLAFFMLGK